MPYDGLLLHSPSRPLRAFQAIMKETQPGTLAISNPLLRELSPKGDQDSSFERADWAHEQDKIPHQRAIGPLVSACSYKAIKALCTIYCLGLLRPYIYHRP